MDSKIKTELELVTERAARIPGLASFIAGQAGDGLNPDDVYDALRDVAGGLHVLIRFLGGSCW